MGIDFWPNVIRITQGVVVLSIIYAVVLTAAAWIGRRS